MTLSYSTFHPLSQESNGQLLPLAFGTEPLPEVDGSRFLFGRVGNIFRFTIKFAKIKDASKFMCNRDNAFFLTVIDTPSCYADTSSTSSARRRGGAVAAAYGRRNNGIGVRTSVAASVSAAPSSSFTRTTSDALARRFNAAAAAAIAGGSNVGAVNGMSSLHASVAKVTVRKNAEKTFSCSTHFRNLDRK